MEIKVNLDLQAILASALSAEKLQPILDAAVSRTFKDAISEVTGYNSPFRKALEDQLAEAMPHGLAVSDVVKFQHILNSTMNGLAQDANNATIKVAMDKALKGVIPDVPARIKLSELVQEARNDFSPSSHDPIFAAFDQGEDGYGRLALDRDASCAKYSASIQLQFNDDGEVFALRMNGVAITPAKPPASVITRLESLLMSLYVGRTTLEIDTDEYGVRSIAGPKYD